MSFANSDEHNNPGCSYQSWGGGLTRWASKVVRLVSQEQSAKDLFLVLQCKAKQQDKNIFEWRQDSFSEVIDILKVFSTNFDGRKCVFGTGAVVAGLGTEGRGGGAQKLKTPNVYYYPICSRLAFRGESPAMTLGLHRSTPSTLHPFFPPPPLPPPQICGPKMLKGE